MAPACALVPEPNQNLYTVHPSTNQSNENERPKTKHEAAMEDKELEKALPSQTKELMQELAASWFKLQTTPSLPLEHTIRSQLDFLKTAISFPNDCELVLALHQLVQLRQVLCNAVARWHRIRYVHSMILQLRNLYDIGANLDAASISIPRVPIQIIQSDVTHETAQKISDRALRECYDEMLKCEEKLEVRFAAYKALDDHEFRTVERWHLKNIRSLTVEGKTVVDGYIINYAESARLRLFKELVLEMVETEEMTEEDDRISNEQSQRIWDMCASLKEAGLDVPKEIE
ncbi:hypothetical protein ABW21_db0202555 [Orbilia brochopaga]|nr:hypothetical protein ABW21_db0202555 [Drechslerella brochopaga]